ncbi:hypothetical protein KC19_8G104800, partial [Ceratodon purpureus]
ERGGDGGARGARLQGSPKHKTPTFTHSTELTPATHPTQLTQVTHLTEAEQQQQASIRCCNEGSGPGANLVREEQSPDRQTDRQTGMQTDREQCKALSLSLSLFLTEQQEMEDDLLCKFNLGSGA